MTNTAEQVRESVNDFYRLESRRILATLICLLAWPGVELGTCGL